MCKEMEEIWFAKSAWDKQVDEIIYVKPKLPDGRKYVEERKVSMIMRAGDW